MELSWDVCAHVHVTTRFSDDTILRKNIHTIGCSPSVACAYVNTHEYTHRSWVEVMQVRVRRGAVHSLGGGHLVAFDGEHGPIKSGVFGS